MEIQVPKIDTNEPKKSNDQWDTISVTYKTETGEEQTTPVLEILGYFSKLSQKTRELDDKLTSFGPRMDLAEENAEKILKVTEKTQNLVIFGFFVLLLMVAGLVFAYWQFTYENGLATQQKILELEQKSAALDSLKKCLAAGGWKVCLAQ